MPKRKFYQEPEEERERKIPTTRYRPDYRQGLTRQQVQEHRLHGWTNKTVDSSSKTTKEIVQENIFTYFNLIFAVLAVLLCIVGSFRDLTFLPVIIANTLIGIIQEVRAKQVLDNLTMLNAPRVTVVREGKRSVVDSEDLVIDDIVIFKAGSQVCADAEVCAGEVQVNESLLTGESDEITKRRGDRLMSGSFIVSGQCHARLDKVGEDSYISKLTLQAKEMQEGEQSEMIRSLDKLVKWVGVAIIPIGLILFCQSFFFQQAACAVYPGKLQTFLHGKTGKDRRHTSGDHGFPRSRASDHQQVVHACRRDLSCPFCSFLTVYLPEIHRIYFSSFSPVRNKLCPFSALFRIG